MSLLAQTNPFFSLFAPGSVGLACLIISVVGATGLALGSISVKGIKIGIAGVMFTGLFFGWLLERIAPAGAGVTSPVPLNIDIMNFARDFGLLIFVYAVGIQVGAGFLASLRKNGLPLNLMAVSIVLCGAVIAVSLHYIAGIDIKVSAGLFAGATTNAPAVGAAQEALNAVHPANGPALFRQFTSPSFALAYPFGLLGVILSMVLIRLLFRVDLKQAAESLEAADVANKKRVSTLNIELRNPNLNHLPLRDFPAMDDTEVVISRIARKNKVQVASPDTTVELGDVLLAVGPPEELNELRLIVGNESNVDLRQVPSEITTRVILVTHREALGRRVDELDLPRRLGVTITRVVRADIEFTAVGDFELQFGDRVRAVGEAAALDRAARELGDSVRVLNLTRLLPIFIGLMFGVTVGMLPSPVKFGLPAALKLGMAAGPMIVAIILARIGRIGPLIWYMPHNASMMLRELGITLFLIAVGLNAAHGFFAALGTSEGYYWLLLGTLVTFLPLMLVGVIAKTFFNVNYLHICGLLCGSMTSPSFAFVSTFTTSEAPAVAFATVYPLTMILRVLTAQLIILIFAS